MTYLETLRAAYAQAREENDFAAVYDTFIFFREVADETAEGEICEPETFFAEFGKMKGETLAHVIMQLPLGDVDMEKPNKHLAVDVAEVLGPDYA